MEGYDKGVRCIEDQTQDSCDVDCNIHDDLVLALLPEKLVDVEAAENEAQAAKSEHDDFPGDKPFFLLRAWLSWSLYGDFHYTNIIFN